MSSDVISKYLIPIYFPSISYKVFMKNIYIFYYTNHQQVAWRAAYIMQQGLLYKSKLMGSKPFLTLFYLGEGAIRAPPTIYPSAVTVRSGVGSPNFMTLFLLVFAKTQ